MKFVIFVLLIAVGGVYQFGAPEKFRTKKNFQLAKSYVGPKLAVRIFGEYPDEVSLPPIPELKANAKSIDVYSKKEVSVKINPKKKQKLDYLFITELMQAIQQRKIEPSEEANWMNVLSQGGSREGVYRAMILGDDYGSLENFNNATIDGPGEFAVWFLEKYINQTVKKETLLEMNFYSVKRLVCEKALEVLDMYSEPNLQADWYAVLSSELAKKYDFVFSSKIRKDTRSLRHQAWAMAVPTQHIKSETLIKLHQVFNHLQGK